ncbi:MAG: hypothetical protein FWG37_06795 [Clostridia bacterium]|nr:hypothetical protein [Clostridia bacterium]
MFGKNRVEEDLARIREANLPPEKRRAHKTAAMDDKVGAKDILAMIIAVFSIVLPYAALFIGVMGLFVWLISRFF